MFKKLSGLFAAAVVALVLCLSVGVQPAHAQGAPGNAGTVTAANLAPGGGGAVATITSGCATVSALVGEATAIQFSTTATTCTPVITFAITAPNGWACLGIDITHPVVFTQTAKSTTTCTITATTTSADVIVVVAFQY